MQKYNSLSSFISALEDLTEHLGDDEGLDTVQSSTALDNSAFINSISSDDWGTISDIIDNSFRLEDIHKQDVYLRTELQDLGYTDNEISEILEFAEVYDNENN
jgi:hypothetical protein